MNTVYLETYFITVSSILGTGFLGLSLTLVRSGVYPFLVNFIFATVIKILEIFFTVEILQKCHALQVKHLKEKSNANIYETLEDHSKNEGQAILSKQDVIKPPDFHLLGELLLGYGFKYVFDALVIIDLVTFLIVYALAGSESFGELLGIKYVYIIPVFIWCLAFIVIFAVSYIRVLISVLTLCKGVLFSLTVIVVLFVTSARQENASNDFNYIQDSFLMSTITTGGGFFVMPFLFAKIENESSQIKKYRLAVVMGLITCSILNIIWCWVVFDIVPQHCSPIIERNQSSHEPIVCNSLESSKENGEISTVPLLRIIRQEHPSYLWVAMVIEIFITISVTSSFITVGTASHHIICGIVESKLSSCPSLESKRSKNIAKICTSSFISISFFAMIFIFAMLNPKAFLDVMEKFNSVIAYLLFILICFMFLSSRRKDKINLEIPLPVPNILVPSVFLVLLYCFFGIGDDIYIIVMSYLHSNNI